QAPTPRFKCHITTCCYPYYRQPLQPVHSYVSGKVVKMKLLYSLLLLLWCLFDPGFPWIVSDEVSVMEGDSVTLNTGFEVKQDIKWYFNDICIAQISRDQRKICTD
ncbi:hypothetical protein PO909_028319, partial [Leuciscus waleckii]